MANWRDYLENILIAVFLALVVRTFVLTGYKVPTSSMMPTLLPGDFIFSYRPPFGIRVPLTEQKLGVNAPTRGQVVVFSYPDQPKINYVKRVIGLPGDHIFIESGELSVNGQKSQYRDVSPAEMQEKIPDFPNAELFQMREEKNDQSTHFLLYQKSHKSQNFGPFIVPPNEVFLLGDNRDSSDDSRYWGTVPIDRIEGQVVWIWLSLNWQKKIWENRIPTLRAERIGQTPR